MWHPSAAECQEKDHDARYNGLMPRENAGGQCPRPAHSGASGLASWFLQGTELHLIALLEPAPEPRTSRACRFF